MRISDLITVRGAPRAVDLAQVSQLMEMLAREGSDLTLGTAGQLEELLGEYVAADAEPVDALRALISAVAAGGEGGSAALASCDGCHKVTALVGVENPGTALLLVEWDSVAAHEAAKSSDSFRKFVEIAGPFLGGGSTVLHYR